VEYLSHEKAFKLNARPLTHGVRGGLQEFKGHEFSLQAPLSWIVKTLVAIVDEEGRKRQSSAKISAFTVFGTGGFRNPETGEVDPQYASLWRSTSEIIAAVFREEQRSVPTIQARAIDGATEAELSFHSALVLAEDYGLDHHRGLTQVEAGGATTQLASGVHSPTDLKVSDTNGYDTTALFTYRQAPGNFNSPFARACRGGQEPFACENFLTSQQGERGTGLVRSHKIPWGQSSVIKQQLGTPPPSLTERPVFAMGAVWNALFRNMEAVYHVQPHRESTPSGKYLDFIDLAQMRALLKRACSQPAIGPNSPYPQESSISSYKNYCYNFSYLTAQWQTLVGLNPFDSWHEHTRVYRGGVSVELGAATSPVAFAECQN
jgi:hypothetical protein